MPVRGERAMSEVRQFQGFQAGLSWLTILKKARQRFREASMASTWTWSAATTWPTT